MLTIPLKYYTSLVSIQYGIGLFLDISILYLMTMSKEPLTPYAEKLRDD